jgi:hypothetical protein
LKIKPSKYFLDYIEKHATFEKKDTSVSNPILLSFVSKSNGTEDTANIGDNCIVEGKNLKFKEANPEEGMFLINSAGEEFRMTEYLLNQDKVQTFRVLPTLAVREYTVVVKNSISEKARIGSYASRVVIS